MYIVYDVFCFETLKYRITYLRIKSRGYVYGRWQRDVISMEKLFQSKHHLKGQMIIKFG